MSLGNRLSLDLYRGVARGLVGLGFGIVIGCGEAPSTDGTGGASATGGMNSGTGGSVDEPYQQPDWIRPTGPDVFEAGHQCSDAPCEEPGSPEGEFEVVGRCDTTGTWVDPECPAASYAWTLVETSGRIWISGAAMEWRTSTTVDWTISIPASCGGCESEPELRTRVATLTCSPSADGSCSCTGRGEDVADWKGLRQSNGQVGAKLVEMVPGVLPGNEPSHPYVACFGETDAIFVDDKMAHLQLRRVSE